MKPTVPIIYCATCTEYERFPNAATVEQVEMLATDPECSSMGWTKRGAVWLCGECAAAGDPCSQCGALNTVKTGGGYSWAARCRSCGWEWSVTFREHAGQNRRVRRRNSDLDSQAWV